MSSARLWQRLRRLERQAAKMALDAEIAGRWQQEAEERRQLLHARMADPQYVRQFAEAIDRAIIAEDDTESEVVEEDGDKHPNLKEWAASYLAAEKAADDAPPEQLEQEQSEMVIDEPPDRSSRVRRSRIIY